MKVIPIIPHASIAAAAGSCNEESGDVPKLDLPLTRRSLLRGSGLLLGTLAAGGVLTALAPSRVWQFGVREQRPAHLHQRRAFGAAQGFQLDGPGAGRRQRCQHATGGQRTQ